jgi:hypothetical protein
VSCCAGDKTIAMWLMNAELYDGMSTFTEASTVIVRGMALHKMIHGLTMALGAQLRAASSINCSQHARTHVQIHTHAHIHALSLAACTCLMWLLAWGLDLAVMSFSHFS